MLTISDDVLKSSGLSEIELQQEIAVMLYAKGKLSIGKAKNMLNMTILEFQKLLCEKNIPQNYSVQDFEHDLKTIEQLHLI